MQSSRHNGPFFPLYSYSHNSTIDNMDLFTIGKHSHLHKQSYTYTNGIDANLIANTLLADELWANEWLFYFHGKYVSNLFFVLHTFTDKMETYNC